MNIYSSAQTGCVHRILATLKVKDSESNYTDFIRAFCGTVTEMQCNALEYVFCHLLCRLSLTFTNLDRNEKALVLWNERCTARRVTLMTYVFDFSNVI